MSADSFSTSGDLPPDWNWVRLGDVCDVVNGSGFPTRYQGRTSLTFPFVKVSDMNSSEDGITINSAANTVDERTLKTIRAKVCPAGTVIFPKVGGAVFTNKKRILGITAAFDNNIMGLVPTNVSSSWLFFCTQGIDLSSLANIQALPSIKASVVKGINLPLPPLAEQKRIVAILNEQLAAVERARKAAEERLEAARALRKVILHDAFESLSSQEWPRVPLGDLLRLRKEIVHPKDKPLGASTFVGLQHIESGTGKRLGQDQVEKSELTGRKPVFHGGDIVYGYLRPYLNKVWVSEFDGLCSVDQYVYKVNTSKVRPHFLATFMRSGSFLQRAPIDESPGQLPRIRTQEVASVWINLPPLNVQEAIESSVKAQEQISDDLVEAAEMAKDSIEAIATALLRRAFSGEI